MAKPDDEKSRFLTTAQMAARLHLNEKKIYVLAGQKKIPAVRISGKWLFPADAVEAFLNRSIVYPDDRLLDRVFDDLCIIQGSDDPLFREIIQGAGKLAGFPAAVSVQGSRGGMEAVAAGRAHAATVHFVVESGISSGLKLPEDCYLVCLFSRRQGFIFKPRGRSAIRSCEEIVEKKLRLALRESACGTWALTRSLFEKEGYDLMRYRRTAGPFLTHYAAAHAVAAGQADVCVGISGAAALLGLGFHPLLDEKFYLMVPSRFMGQRRLMRLIDAVFDVIRRTPDALKLGYDFGDSGKIRVMLKTGPEARA